MKKAPNAASDLIAHIRRQRRLIHEIARVDAGLDSIALRQASLHHESRRRALAANLRRDVRLPIDVLAGFDLRARENRADALERNAGIRNIGRRDREHVGAERARCRGRELARHDAERGRRELPRRERRCAAHETPRAVAARCARAARRADERCRRLPEGEIAQQIRLRERRLRIAAQQNDRLSHRAVDRDVDVERGARPG